MKFIQTNTLFAINKKLSVKCKKNHVNPILKKEYIYILRAGKTSEYKIGKTTNPKERLKKYRTENAKKIKIIILEKVVNSNEIERELLFMFRRQKMCGRREWFLLGKKNIKKALDYTKENKNKINPERKDRVSHNQKSLPLIPKS